MSKKTKDEIIASLRRIAKRYKQKSEFYLEILRGNKVMQFDTYCAGTDEAGNLLCTFSDGRKLAVPRNLMDIESEIDGAGDSGILVVDAVWAFKNKIEGLGL